MLQKQQEGDVLPPNPYFPFQESQCSSCFPASRKLRGLTWFSERDDFMELSYVFALSGLILLTMVTWACILATTALLLPRQSAKAEATLEGSPVASFFGGLGMAILVIFA